MKWITLLVIAFSFSQIQAAENKHSLGGLYGTGVANAEIDNEDDDWAAQQGIFYEYHIDSNLTIHTAIIEGADDFCLIVCSIGEEILDSHHIVNLLHHLSTFPYKNID